MNGRNRLSAKYSRRLEILISAFHLNLTYTCTCSHPPISHLTDSCTIQDHARG